jgi:two-component system, sensor histidine kinase and response regulator
MKDIRVLDKTVGLRNMAGDVELYHLVLDEFFNENQDTIDNLDIAISEKRYTDAAQIVHKVKGSSGSIGAKSLYDISVMLHKALKEEREEEILSLKENFSQLLRRLLEEIKEFKN